MIHAFPGRPHLAYLGIPEVRPILRLGSVTAPFLLPLVDLDCVYHGQHHHYLPMRLRIPEQVQGTDKRNGDHGGRVAFFCSFRVYRRPMHLTRRQITALGGVATSACSTD